MYEYQLMSNLAPEQESQISKLSRTPITIVAICCVIMIIVGISAAMYAYFSTPEIVDVQVFVNEQVGQRMEAKSWYLAQPILFLIGLTSIMAYFSLSWRKFIRKSVEKERSYGLIHSLSYLNVTSSIVLIIFSMAAIANFGSVLYRVATILHLASSGK